MGRGAWKATVQGVLESDTSEPLSLPLHGMILKSKLTVIIKFPLNTHTHTHTHKKDPKEPNCFQQLHCR